MRSTARVDNVTEARHAVAEMCADLRRGQLLDPSFERRSPRLDPERESLQVETPSDPIDAMALAESHPRWLVARWVARWGEEETLRLLRANNTEAPLVLRPVHVVREQLEAMLESAGIAVAD